ncbi:MAG: phosphate acyltransferase, partial [Deltaproteobacteria bacterium]|nr:phosphate acyltransferase [Deltaproteobacteria bacterium]
MRIAVDAMGGDHAPSVVIEAALEATGLSIPVMLVGDRAQVEAELERHTHAHALVSSGLLTVKHASQVIGMCESPI